nr:hypothetical protein BHI3_03720 [Bacteriovorax sp. HI3]
MKMMMTILSVVTSLSLYAQSPRVLSPGEVSPEGDYICASAKAKPAPKHTCSIRMSSGFFGKEDAGNDSYVYVDDVLYATFKAYNPLYNCYEAERLVKKLELDNKCTLVRNACRVK